MSTLREMIGRATRRRRRDGARLAALLLLLILLGPLQAGAAEGWVSEPAGFVRLAVPSNTSTLVAMPFEPFNGMLAAVFSNQLTGSSNEDSADRVLKWDPVAQQYVVSFKADGTGDPGKDRYWFDSGTNWVLSTQTVAAGQGFWIQNRHGNQQVFLHGAVVLVDTQSISFLQGLNLFGYPYSSRLALNDTDLAGDGARGGTNAASADLVETAASNTYWLLDQPGHAYDGKWLDETGEVAGLVLDMGQGFWFSRNIASNLLWTESRPYGDIFDPGTNGPHITALVVGTGGETMTLSISCSGEQGETLEVFYKDLQPTDAFNAGSGWYVAGENLTTTGATALAWSDAGSSTRPGVTGVFCRVFLLGRQDVDTDADELSDAREIFVHATSETDWDTDGDQLDDGTEVQDYGSDPNDPDTDDDAMGDGTEAFWGASPTTDDGYATLPWSDDFESQAMGELDGQNGWAAMPPSAAVVQSNTVFGGAKSVEMLRDSGTSNLLQNASFETAGTTSDDAKNWQWDNPDQHGSKWGGAFRKDWQSHSGSWEGAIGGDWTGSGSGGFWQEARATPGATYTFSAWFWADWTWTNQADQGLRIEFLSGDDQGTNSISQVYTYFNGIGENWVQKPLRATAPENAEWVRAVIWAGNVGSQGALQFDDLSLMESLPAAVAHFFGSGRATNVWVDMQVTPVPGALPEIGGFTSRPTAVVAANEAGRLCGYDGLAGVWVVATNGPAATGQWMRLTISTDYGSRRWRLNKGGILILDDLGFADANVSEFSKATWFGTVLDDSHLDNVTITATEPNHLDDDGDGMPNVWERQYGLSVNNPADAGQDPDNDGLTSLEEYQHGTHPGLQDTDGDGIVDGSEVAWGKDPTASNTYEVLPWASGFETNEGYAVGNLDGQDGWKVAEGSASVQTTYVAAGAQAALLDQPATGSVSTLEHLYAGPTGTVTWTDLKVRMVPAPPPDLGSASNRLTAAVALGEDQRLVGYDGTSSTWLTASNAPDVALSEWTHLTVKQDYAGRKWTLYWDGVPVLKDLGFADISVDRMSRVAVSGGSALGDSLDDLSMALETPSHIDDDFDGLANAVEDANTNGVVDGGETDPFDPDTDNDGMDDGAELMWGLDPTGSNSFSRLPWSAEFEQSESYTNGPLDGQPGPWGWTASTSVYVQSAVRHGGTNAAKIGSIPDAPASMNHHFGAQGVPEVWFDAYAKLIPGVLPDPAALSGDSSVLVAVNPEGLVCAYDGEGGGWIPSPFDYQTSPDTWVRLTFRVNYSLREWDMYVDGELVFREMPFFRNAARSLSRISVLLPDGSTLARDTYVDTMSLSVAEPAGLDNDGDGMPNTWEVQHGLNPGSANDKLADGDQDQLSNLEEYWAGTDPNVADTDGDGVSDGVEVRYVFTDPLSADINGYVTTISEVDGSDFVEAIGDWGAWGTEAYSRGIRGRLDYDVAVPVAGVCRVEVVGWGYGAQTAELHGYVDSQYVGTAHLRLGIVATNTCHFFTPWLTQGVHRVGLYWDNVQSSPRLRITSIRIQQVGGVDSDSDGEPDWLEHRFSQIATVDSLCVTSKVSPYCMEGNGRFLDMMTLSCGVQPRHGVGNRWYADVPLSSAGPTSVVVSFEQGARVFTNTITWTAHNILTDGDLTVRKNDAVLLTAQPAGATGGTVHISIVGVTNYETDIWTPIAHTFSSGGTFGVVGTFENGTITSNAISVGVVEASFPTNPPAVWRGKQRTWFCPLIGGYGEVIEADLRTRIAAVSGGGAGTTFSLDLSDVEDEHYVVARVRESGAILSSSRINGFWVVANADGIYYVVDWLPDGTRVVENRLIARHLPDSVFLELAAFVGGVAFDNGGPVKNVFPGDLLGTDEYNYRLFISPGYDAACHTIRAIQDGVTLGQR